VSERDRDERPDVGAESPEDLDPRAEAEQIRGGAVSNVQKTKEDAAKAAIDNTR
jgi:hypothetical protein